jgi:RND family efflux transporter MFP subunit
MSQVEDYLILRAPFAGMITERNIHPGALVGPSAKNSDGPMLSLQQLNKLRLVVNVPETSVPNIDNKDWITFTLPAYPEREFKAKVARQSGIVSSNVRSEAIELDVPDYKGEVKPGMYAEVRLPLNSSTESYMVPTSAIVHSTKGVYLVGIDGNNRTRFLMIQEGMNTNDSTEVYGHLSDGERILLHPNAEMEEGVALH